jgi:hypothetical protein
VQILKSDLVVCVDVDDTLVSWSQLEHIPECINIRGVIEIDFNDVKATYQVYSDNVESLMTHHHKGHYIVVWSGSGCEWALAVVEALKLEAYVDVVMAKPRWLLDDMKPEEFMPRPYWGAGDPGKAKIK